MRYVSPFSFIAFDTEQKELSSKDLFLAKRKLLSEFDLQGTSTIQLNGAELSKNDVLNIFSQLETDSFIKFHLIVAADKTLLYFLEHDKIEYDTHFSVSQTDLTNEFVAWISPYFKNSFIVSATSSFKSRDIYSFAALMGNPHYVTANDGERIWEPLYGLIESCCEEMIAISDAENHLTKREDISRLTSPEQIGMLRKLPEDRFAQQINLYAFEMMRMSVGVFNKIDRALALQIIESGLSMPLSQETKVSLLRKKHEMEDIRSRSGGSNKPASSNSGTNWGVIRLIIFIMIAVLKIATCTSNSSPTYTSYQYQPSTDLIDPNMKPEDIIKALAKKEKLKKVNTANVNIRSDSAIYSFMYGIQDNSSDYRETENSKPLTLTTGSDPFNKTWRSLFFQKEYLRMKEVFRKNDYDTSERSMIFKNPVTKFLISNKSRYNAIVVINRGDSVFSTYVKAGENTKIPLLTGCFANAFVYAGNKFVAFKKQSINLKSLGDHSTVDLRGVFMGLSGGNTELMAKPISVKAVPGNNSSLIITDKDALCAQVEFEE